MVERTTERARGARARDAGPQRDDRPDPVLKPTLVLVGAQKGGVGKTTTARLLLHWLEEAKRRFVAFDTENPAGSLARFYPDVTEVLDIAQVSAQMRILDAFANAADESVFVVDLRAGYFFNILDIFDDLMIFRDARRGAFNLLFLHVVGSTKESTAEVATSLERFDGARHVVVRNVASGANLSGWDRSDVRHAFLRQGGLEIDIPPLDPLAYQAIDDASASFKDFVENRGAGGDAADHSYTLRAYTRKWLILSMSQIDKLKL